MSHYIQNAQKDKMIHVALYTKGDIAFERKGKRGVWFGKYRGEIIDLWGVSSLSHVYSEQVSTSLVRSRT